MVIQIRVLFLTAALAAVASIAEEACVDLPCDGFDSDDEGALASVELLQQTLMIDKEYAELAAPATTTETTTLPPTGMTLNAAGDLSAFMSALVLNSGAIVFMFVVFSVLRLRYPLIYSNNAIKGFAPSNPPQETWSWYRASIDVTIDQATESIGLDNAMMLEFSHLAMRIMATIGIPMLFIVGPMHWIFGGDAAGEDHMSYLSFGNVCSVDSKKASCKAIQNGGTDLYWVHGFIVWGVVLVVQSSLYKAQRDFMHRRFKWLRTLPEKRANTVLVTGIPNEYQSDEKLKGFFSKMLPGDKILEATTVKDTSNVLGLVNQLKAAKSGLTQCTAQWAQNGNVESERPMVRESLMGAKVDGITYYSKRIEELEPQVMDAQSELKKQALETGGVNLSNGFVTFKERHDAEIALHMELSMDQEEWVMLTPPDATDVLWNDLTQDPLLQRGRTVIGYLLVAALYFAYMPIVIGITNIANIINMGPFQPIWQGLAPTMGLQFMVAFLPTFLILIFQFFFTVYAEAWTQHKLQKWYFTFQVFFVILATAIGQNVMQFTNTLFTDPFAIFGVLADTMPYATHFFMNFLVLQWVTHSMNLTRYVPVAKFILARALFDDEDARVLSEPEDQDYYGIGSRSARWTIALLIGIIYGTLSPPINLLCFINFAVVRLVYGYLICFAETKKADLGGVFFVQCLRNLFVGNVIYCILMTGVLLRRSPSYGPAVIAAPSIGYVIWSMQRFDAAFAWEKLPFKELMETPAGMHKKREMDGSYIQPELLSQGK